jgi:hypothetical protein
MKRSEVSDDRTDSHPQVEPAFVVSGTVVGMTGWNTVGPTRLQMFHCDWLIAE